MTEKHRDRSINMIISLIITIAGVFIAANLSGNAAENKAIRDSINTKADKSYVDTQNNQQDRALDKILLERDKRDEMLLQRLDYIILRVDNMSN